MAVLKTHDKYVEVSSELLVALVAGAGPFKMNVLSQLKKQGITDLKPGEWYSDQAVYDAVRGIAQNSGENTLTLFGRNFYKNIGLPGDAESIGKAIADFDDFYRANHRNGECGSYKYRQAEEREVSVFCSSPYPCAFDQGILQEICDRFQPEDSACVTIEHPSATGCRMTGGVGCTYLIRW